MERGSMTDQQLLWEFRRGSGEAFAEIVRRHTDWVYSAARRRVRDPSVAEDVTQATFIVLAKKAEGLRPDTLLEPWLFKVMSYTASAAMRSAQRRRRHEQKAAAMHTENTTARPSPGQELWGQVEHVLDEVVASLGAKDREAVLLRFYKKFSYAEIGAALETTEEAARKRVDRAIEKLRSLLQRRGVTTASAGALAAVLVAETTQAATAGLAATTAGVALAAAEGAAAAGLVTVTIANHAVQAMAWAKAATVAATATASVAVLGTTVAVGVTLLGDGGSNSGAAAPAAVATGNMALVSPAPAVPSVPDPVAPGRAGSITDESAVQREPTSAPTERARQAIPAWDESLAQFPIAKGWPLALPGEVISTVTVADIDGDGKPAIIVPTRRRIAGQTFVHPEPTWAAQLWAFRADGTVLDGYPIELVKPIETPNPTGFWSSSPSVFVRGGKAHLVISLPLGGGTAIIDPNRTVKRIGPGNAAVNVPIAQIDDDGIPDMAARALVQNVDGGAINGWPKDRTLGGYGSSIGDADGDGSVEIFRPSYPLNEDPKIARLVGFDKTGIAIDGWPATIPSPNYFPPVIGDVSGDRAKEIVGAYGTKLFAWTRDGKPAANTDGGVLVNNVTAWQSSPALADLDGDGKAEIIVFDQATLTLRAFNGDGAGAGGASEGVIATLPAMCAGVSVVDLGSDGTFDIFTGTYWIKWKPGPNQGTVINMLPAPAEINFAQPTIADVDGDGTMEAIFGLRDGRLFVYQTRMGPDPDDMHWPTSNGSFAHTGVYPAPPLPVSP